MNNPENNKWLDKILGETIGSEKIKPDFEQWKQNHPHAVETLTSRTDDTQVSKRPIKIKEIIMKNSIIKLVVAAVIIISVCFFAYKYGNSVNLVNATFAQVQNAMKEVSWLHIVFTGEDRDDHDISHLWAGFENGVYASKLLDNYTRYVNLNEEKEYNFNPETNTISISTVNKDEFEYDLSSSWAMLESIILNLTDEGATVEYSTRRFHDQDIKTITLKHINEESICTCRIFINPETYLIIGGEQIWENKYDNQIINTQIEVKYPEKGPQNIYDLGISRTADILDYTGT